MSTLASTVDLLQLFGEPTRVRLVALLARHELTVAELVHITELAQSRVSTHLGKLRDADVVKDRRAGASTFYALHDGAMPERAQAVWRLLDAQTCTDPLLASDAARCTALLDARAKATAWPDALAGQMERHYSPGRTWEATARAFAVLTRLGDVLDVGAGDGTIAQLLAPRAASFTLLDRSDRMIEAARARLGREPFREHLRFVVGDAHDLPFEAGRFDQVLLFNVLTHAQAPSRVLDEAARVLRPRGSVALVTLNAHPHRDEAAAYGHVQPGFAPETLRSLLQRAGLDVAQAAITSREKKVPHFQIVTALATKP